MTNYSSSKQSRILVFDVNETLLDVQALQPFFKDHFGDGAVLKEWFSQTLLYSQTATTAGPYADFSKIARLALEMTARIHRVQFGDADAELLFGAMRTLPVHSDVPGALQRLREHGFRLFTLTNSAPDVLRAQMEAAGLASLFERLLSVDPVEKFKPHPATYKYVAHLLGMPPGKLTMIAAHPWDLIGARAVGYKPAFVERTRTAWFHLTPKPEISGPTMDEIATQLISMAEDH